MSAIEVVDYDPGWPELFGRWKRRLRTILPDLLDEAHHIGSTSVPGLRAKPRIDIDAVLLSEVVISDAIDRVRSLEEVTFHGDPYRDGMWTFTQGRGSYGARLYLCGPDNATHRKRVLFRDWLRSHPVDAEAYAALKRELAVTADGDWKAYTAGKAEFVARIVALASTSAEATRRPVAALPSR